MRLSHRVVPDGILIDAALEFANIVAERSPLGIRNIKRLVNEGLNLNEQTIAFLGIQMVSHYTLTSYDCHEGLRAFSEKRKPKFEGR